MYILHVCVVFGVFCGVGWNLMLGTLTGFVRHRSVVGVGQVRQVNQAVCVYTRIGRCQICRFGGAMAAAAQQSVARALQQTARHPADQKELARAALVLALQLAIDATVVDGICVWWSRYWLSAGRWSGMWLCLWWCVWL